MQPPRVEACDCLTAAAVGLGVREAPMATIKQWRLQPADEIVERFEVDVLVGVVLYQLFIFGLKPEAQAKELVSCPSLARQASMSRSPGVSWQSWQNRALKSG